MKSVADPNRQLAKLGLMKMAGKCISSYRPFQNTLADLAGQKLVDVLMAGLM